MPGGLRATGRRPVARHLAVPVAPVARAELVAIDGVYQTADDMPAAAIGKPAQAWLDGDTMRITTLD